MEIRKINNEIDEQTIRIKGEIKITCNHNNRIYIGIDIFYCQDCGIWYGKLFNHLFGKEDIDFDSLEKKFPEIYTLMKKIEDKERLEN